ncbi:hypothetical protein GJ496_008953, partial [Pomphorhynchus laevis]
NKSTIGVRRLHTTANFKEREEINSKCMHVSEIYRDADLFSPGDDATMLTLFTSIDLLTNDKAYARHVSL